MEDLEFDDILILGPIAYLMFKIADLKNVFKNYRIAKKIDLLGTVKASSAKRGPVEMQGFAFSGREKFFSPLFADEVVFLKFNVLRRNWKGGQFTTIATFPVMDRFWIVDDTGFVAVDGEVSVESLNIRKSRSRVSNLKADRLKALVETLERYAPQVRLAQLRAENIFIEEESIKSGGAIYARGYFSDDSGEGKVDEAVVKKLTEEMESSLRAYRLKARKDFEGDAVKFDPWSLFKKVDGTTPVHYDPSNLKFRGHLSAESDRSLFLSDKTEAEQRKLLGRYKLHHVIFEVIGLILTIFFIPVYYLTMLIIFIALG